MNKYKNIAYTALLGAFVLSSCVQGDLYDDLYDEDMPSWMMIGRRKFKNDNGDNGNNGNNDPDPYDWLHEGLDDDPWGGTGDQSGQTDNQTHNNPIVPHLPDPQVEVPDVIPMPESDLGYWRKWIDRMPTARDIRSSMGHVMEAAWTAVLNNCTATEMGELGFWIYYNPLTRVYSRSIFYYGDKVPYIYDQKVLAPINVTDRNPPEEDISLNGRGFVCGWCHVHPRLENFGGYHFERNGVGPSDKDIELAWEWGLPGFVVDYNYDCDNRNCTSRKMKITHYGPTKREKDLPN